MALRPVAGRANTRVVFLGAASHSGSTLLGLMLGAHPQIFFAGEARKSVKRIGEKKFCKMCGRDCSVWGNGLRLQSGEGLYEILSRRTGRPIVFDSTKSVPWIETQLLLLRDVVTLDLIVLTRDGRAVVNSYLRKHPEVSAREHALAWLEQMHAVECLAARWPGKVHRIRYEEFTSNPEPELRGVSRFLGVPFDRIMLDPWGREQHILGGNAGTRQLMRRRLNTAPGADAKKVKAVHRWYTRDRVRLAPDLRWRHEMGKEALAVFDEVVGAANRIYAWNEDEGAS